MKKVYQTRTDPVTGNCFAACIASLLELPIEETDFLSTYKEGEENHDWMRDEMNPVLDRLGYIYFEVPVKDNTPELHFLPNNMLFIATGKSPRYDCHHAIIVRLEYKDMNDLSKGSNLWIEHDPCPNSKESITDFKYLGFLLPKQIHCPTK